jgi:hypothetical protein
VKVAESLRAIGSVMTSRWRRAARRRWRQRRCGRTRTPAGPSGPAGAAAQRIWYLAWIPVFSSMQITTVAWWRAHVHIAHRGSLGPELLVIAAVQAATDPVRRQFQAGQDLPTWETGVPVPAKRAAIMLCVHADAPSGGKEVAVATIANRTSGPYTPGRPRGQGSACRHSPAGARERRRPGQLRSRCAGRRRTPRPGGTA